MNINDVDKVKEYPENILEVIFAKQGDLMAKYHEIEKKNGLLQTETFPMNLHDRFCQARIKDFLWRTTEELAESLEALRETLDDEHVKEEVIDALHFHTENCIQCGLTAEDIMDSMDAYDFSFMIQEQQILAKGSDVHMLFLGAVESLGLAGNCLKNKPWKQDHKLTDIVKFTDKMCNAYENIIAILTVGFKMSAEDIFDMYFRKHAVNQFRQRSGY